MRSNSGKDEARNNLHDPTLRDKELGRDPLKAIPSEKTTGMGSGARKDGQKGDVTKEEDQAIR
jgi:hypothetical protein